MPTFWCRDENRNVNYINMTSLSKILEVDAKNQRNIVIILTEYTGLLLGNIVKKRRMRWKTVHYNQ